MIVELVGGGRDGERLDVDWWTLEIRTADTEHRFAAETDFGLIGRRVGLFCLFRDALRGKGTEASPRIFALHRVERR